MDPRSWRVSAGITLTEMARKHNIAAGYLSEVERGIKPASGSVQRAYDEESAGEVRPSDFQVVA